MKHYTKPTVKILLLTAQDVFLYASVDDLDGGAHNKGFEDQFFD